MRTEVVAIGEQRKQGGKINNKWPHLLVWNLAETGWKILFRLNCYERKYCFDWKKTKQTKYRINRTGPKLEGPWPGGTRDPIREQCTTALDAPHFRLHRARNKWHLYAMQLPGNHGRSWIRDGPGPAQHSGTAHWLLPKLWLQFLAAFKLPCLPLSMHWQYQAGCPI